ncbi:hypothetical protein H072_1243 [Dactylellina haptotyla CBS 200.50]|uniref:DUF1014 domain protein n=1 Tax=Dactylellina haptotyla (strain CBS 200.50) TaxID=1284197 RepID=S8APH2_DACHA|nr:hypothetical protein H072_1243 [Dactylellina haptotyla CBS 200.50]
MGKPKAENSKKAAGNARKAEAAASKQAKVDSVKAAKEDEEWADGAKDTSKKAASAAKKAEAAAKKAARDAELETETAALKTAKANPKAGTKGKAVAAGPSRGLDAALSSLDEPSSSTSATLNASGIDNALDALSLTSGSASSATIERHPERRFKAAYAIFEDRRMLEGKADGTWDGLRQNQIQARIRKEFEKSEENPFNQATVSFDATKGEIRAAREREVGKMEKRLADRS